MSIGVFDSGLGGLTVLRGLTAAMPNQSFLYLGDNASAPYGARSAEEVAALTEAGVARLMADGCRLVILACNTASALALRRIQQVWLPAQGPRGARVLGVFAPMIEAITARDWVDEAVEPDARPSARRRVVVFATPATARSGAFEREAATRAPGLQVRSIGCPGLVDAIEAGDADRAAAVARAAADGLGAEPTTAVLGCTHYPLVENAFRAALPEAAEMLDQPSVVAASLARYLARRPGFEDRAGRVRLLTTGNPATVGARAARFFGRPAAFEAA